MSERELAVLALLATPRTYTQIASELYISRNTVKTHVSNLYTKLGVSTRYEAIERARAAGLLPDDGVLEGEHLRCEALLSTSPDLVIVVDSEQHVICANRTLAEMRGKADVQAGQELNALIHPGDRARVRALIANAVHSPSDAVAFDCRFTCADASSRDLEVLLVNRLDDPAVRGLVLYARDTMYRQAPALRRVVAVRTPDETRRVARELRQQSLDVRASSLALQIRTAMLVRRTPSAPRGSRSQSYVATRATDSDRARS